jgi:glycerol-3-phosphate cytidylyltransferase-like family protein
MKITDLAPRIIAVYAGRFHPFHHGHAEVFRELASKFGINNTYITTSGKVDPNKSPFSFDEKKIMMQAAGVPAGNVVEEIVPYAPVNLPQKLTADPNRDIMVFGVGQKDMAEDPRFAFTPLKDGTASFFQKYTGKNMMPFSNKKNDDGTRAGHGYVIPVADVEFSIAGKKINSASQIRELYKSADVEQRLQILNELYPNGGAKVNSIKRIFDAKLG